MENKRVWKVVNIYRRYSLQLLFTAALCNETIEYFNISPAMSDAVSKGFVYLNDYIKITEQTDEGIIFEIYDGQGDASNNDHSKNSPVEDISKHSPVEEGESLIYSGAKVKSRFSFTQQGSDNFLPFLCDILPYYVANIVAKEAVPIYKNTYFTGKYLIDENEVPNLKSPIPRQFIAKIHQKTRINTTPNSYNPFFFIIVSSNDIWIKVVFWRESMKSYSNLKIGDIIYVIDYKAKPRLHSIDVIEYNTFTESLYFDCDEITAREIAKVENKSKGKVKNIFETVEGRIEYLSVLMRYSCNLCLMEYVLCRVGGKSIILFYNSDDEFKNIKEGKSIKITELRAMKRANSDSEVYVSTIYTQFELLEDGIGKVRYNINSIDNDSAENEEGGSTKKMKIQSEIFGAIGYLPDNFRNVAEVTEYKLEETVGTRKADTKLFMKPIAVSLDSLLQQNLLLNETKKYILSAVVTSVGESSLKIDYYENKSLKQQTARKVVLDGVFDVYLFKNYFIDDQITIENQIGQKVFLIIEGFRVDINTVLYYITGIIPLS